MKSFLSFLFVLFFIQDYAQNVSQFQNLQNIGNNINTDLIETMPRISPNGKILYFTRQNDPRNKGGIKDDGDIWYSIKMQDGTWSVAKNLGKPVNNFYFNQVIAISPNGKIMLTNGKYQPDKHSDIYITAQSYLGWTTPKIIPFKDLDFKNDDATYSATSDLKTLIISMKNYKDSRGKNDLYISFYLPSGEWSLPQNMGDSINTPEDELYPTIAHDNKTLYFSSKGHEGFGNFDIFAVKRKDSTWLHWSSPKNLGKNVNTDGYDADFTFDAEHKYAYISSDKEIIGDFDIYRLVMPEKSKPQAMAFVNISINQPDSNQYSSYKCMDKSSSEIIQAGDSIKENIELLLPVGNEYILNIYSKNNIGIEELIDLKKQTKFIKLSKNYTFISKSDFTNHESDLVLPDFNPQTVNIDNLDSMVSLLHFSKIKIPKIINPKVMATVGMINITLQNIYFGKGQSEINLSESNTLKQLAKELKENPDIKVLVVGHTDDTGNSEINLKISKNRAKKVCDFLNQLGINYNRLKYEGKGEKFPVAPNDTEEHRKFNRRVEIKLYK